MFDEKTFQEIERGALDAARGSKGHYVFAFLGLTLLVGSISKSILAGSKLPHTVFMFMYGCALGGIVIAAPSLSSFAPLSELPPEFILFIFLPILIFEGSFNWEVTVFKDVIAQVILVAFPGLVLAAGITAALCKALFTDWTWSVALLFGSIVSATDPVATVVLLRELGADKYLTGVIDGESLLNDSSAIVMYAVLLPVVETGMVPSASGITLVLCRLVLGAIALGLVIGGLMVFALENTHNEVVVEIIITIGSSMISFYLAEHVLGFSGVITIVVAGLCFAFRRYAVSPVNAHSLNEVWEVLVQIANTMIFTIVGILVVVQGFSHVSLYDVLTLFLVYLILQVARFGMLIVLWPFVGWFRPVSWRGLVLFWFSGIRGAVALALSLAINHNRMIPYHFRHQFLILTAGLVVLTTIINGCFCGPVTRLLGLHKKSASRKQSMAQAVNSIRIAMHQAIAALKVDPVLHNSSWPVVWMRTLYALRDPYYDHTDTEITPRDVHEVAQNTYLRGLRIAVLNLHEHGMLAQGSFYALLTLLNRKISENVLITFEDVQQAIHPLAGISAAKSGRLRQARDFLAHALLWIVPGLKNRQSSQELEVYLAYHDVITSALLRFEREIQQSSKSNLSLYYHTQSELKVVEEKLENMAREHPALDYHFKTRICGYSIFNRGLNAVKEMYENGSLSADEFETVETELQELLRRFVQYSSSHPKVSELELFLNLECFRELPKAQVEVLYETCTKQVFDRNNLFTVPDSHVYIILKGLVSLESNEHAIQGEGALVGLVEEPETSYHALTDVELLVVGRSRLTELAKTAPSFSHLLYTARFAYKSFCVLYPQVQHERRSTLLMLCHQGFLVRILEEGSWTIEPHNIACVLVRGSCVMDVNAMLSRRTTPSELIQVDCSTPKYDAVAALPLGTHEPFIADFTLNSEIFVVPLNFTKLGDDPYRNLIHPTKLNGDIQETDLGAMPSMAFPDAGERYREIDFMQQGLLSSHANVSW